MKRFVLSLLLAASGCASGELMRYSLPDTETDLAFVPASSERTQLGNGIGVLTSGFEHPATTTLALVFGRGYVDERVPGMAMLLGAWLQLEADTNLSPGLDAVGAVVSIDVGTTSTRLMVTVEHRDVPAAMQALSQLLVQADSELAFETAKGHQRGLVASHGRSPAQLARLALVQSTLSPSSTVFDSLGLGTAASLESISFAALKAARNDMFTSASACWLVVGPHDSNAAHAWAEAASGSWPHRASPKVVDVPVTKQPGVFTFVPLRGFDTATILVGTSVPPDPKPAVPIVVGAAMARSNHVMRELTQKTYGARLAVLDDGPLSLWGVTARVPPKDAKDAAGFMMSSFGTAETVTGQQLDYGTTRTVAAAYEQRSLAMVHLLRLNEAFERGYTLPAGAPFQTLPALPGPEQVMRAYRKHFLVKHLHVVIVGDPDVIGPQLKNVTHVVRTPEEILGPQRAAHDEAPAPTSDAEEGRGTVSPWEAEAAGG